MNNRYEERGVGGREEKQRPHSTYLSRAHMNSMSLNSLERAILWHLASNKAPCKLLWIPSTSKNKRSEYNKRGSGQRQKQDETKGQQVNKFGQRFHYSGFWIKLCVWIWCNGEWTKVECTIVRECLDNTGVWFREHDHWSIHSHGTPHWLLPVPHWIVTERPINAQWNQIQHQECSRELLDPRIEGLEVLETRGEM